MSVEATFTPAQVADTEKVSAQTIRNEINAHRLKAYRVGRQFRIPMSAVLEWRERQTV